MLDPTAGAGGSAFRSSSTTSPEEYSLLDDEIAQTLAADGDDRSSADGRAVTERTRGFSEPLV
jgi:hypothetical protein